MKRLAMLSVGALSAIFLLVGCGGGGSQAEQDRAHQKSASSANLDLRPEHDSGVSGTVTFKQISGGVILTLDLRALPKPDTLYLAHIHPGTCAEEVRGEEEGEAQEHGEHHEEDDGHEHGEHHEEDDGHEHGEQIEYPLSQVKSDSEGSGSSTTTLRDTSVENLFSGEPKHVNVHAAGSGDPPILTCADLEEGG